MLEQGETTQPEITQGADTTGTEEELDAATTLLSLGTIRDDTLDDDTENAELMLIGGQNAPIDAALEPIRLDQISVDNTITGLIQEEEVTNEQKSEPKGPSIENTKMTKTTPAAEIHQS